MKTFEDVMTDFAENQEAFAAEVNECKSFLGNEDYKDFICDAAKRAITEMAGSEDMILELCIFMYLIFNTGWVCGQYQIEAE